MLYLKEDTMKDFNRYAALSLRAVLAAAFVMSGCVRPNDHVSLATAPAGAEQPAFQWSQMSRPEVAAVSSLFSNGSDLFAGTRAGVVFRAINQGEGWTAINAGLPGQSVQSLAAIGPNLFAGTDGGGVFRLINQGENQGERWIAVNSGLTNLFVTALAVSGTDIFAATRGGVFRLSDQGEIWTAVNTGLPSNASISSLAAIGPDVFAGLPFLGGSGGVYRSSDRGENWTAVNTGLSNFGVSKIAAVGTGIFAVTDGGVIRSIDQGENWTPVNTGLQLNTRITSFAVIEIGRAHV